MLSHADQGGDSSGFEAVLGLIGVGAIASAVISAAVGYFISRHDRRTLRDEERRNLASAIHGELEAVLKLAPDRYLPALRYGQRRLRYRGDYRFGPAATDLNFFAVYTKNVDKIGLLPTPLPGLIAGQYLNLELAQSDLKTIFLDGWGDLDRIQRLAFLREVEHRLETTVAEGHKVLAALDEFLGLESERPRAP